MTRNLYKDQKPNWVDELPPGPTARIIKRILPLMPPKGTYYNDEQAAEMERKMNQIVDEEFRKI